jgi:hypothetical protein
MFMNFRKQGPACAAEAPEGPPLPASATGRAAIQNESVQDEGFVTGSGVCLGWQHYAENLDAENLEFQHFSNLQSFNVLKSSKLSQL